MKSFLIFLTAAYSLSISILVAEIEFVLPPELSSATNITLTTEKESVQTRVELKKESKWVFKKEDLGTIANSVVWIIVEWDQGNEKQMLQVRGGKVLFFVKQWSTTYKFRIPIDEFFKTLW
jgi:hypothetical protein